MRTRELIDECRRHQKVVNSPPNVFLARSCPITPPAVLLLSRVQVTEGVDKVCRQKCIDTVDFRLHVASTFVVVGFGASKVYVSMCDVEIATDDHRFAVLELTYIG